MEMRSHSDPLGWKGGHDFEPTPATCTTANCHSAMPENFDLNNQITEINNLLDQLITAIGEPIDSLGSATATSPEQRMAGYAYMFVLNDGSHGVHNPNYAKALLENAIDFINTYNAAKSGAITRK